MYIYMRIYIHVFMYIKIHIFVCKHICIIIRIYIITCVYAYIYICIRRSQLAFQFALVKDYSVDSSEIFPISRTHPQTHNQTSFANFFPMSHTHAHTDVLILRAICAASTQRRVTHTHTHTQTHTHARTHTHTHAHTHTHTQINARLPKGTGHRRCCFPPGDITHSLTHLYV